MKKVELLAPAKNLKSIKAGIKYTDAFYFGAKKFNMRMQADNFSFEDLSYAVKFCHNNNKKAYFVSNVLIYEDELKEMKDTIEYCHSIGFDACIVNDPAVLLTCKDIGMKFHISTQQNVTNSKSALFFEKIGAERVILGRETSLNKIKEIVDKLTNLQVETFIHGAMCTMISGKCYFSMACGEGAENSANRGLCLQPCRREWSLVDIKEPTNKATQYYNTKRFLNSRDLCMIEFIPELITSGISSFKIEGRMRSPHYVEVVTKIYREAIESYYNEGFNKKKVGKWIYELKKVYNRGFTQGFYFNRAREEDQQHSSPTNLSHWRLIKIGDIISYTPTNNLATIKITNGFLKEGMEVLIKGGVNSDTYFHQKIKYILKNDKKIINSGKASQKHPLFVSIPVEQKVLKNEDSIFIFTNKTYKNRRTKGSGKKKSEYYRL